MRILKRLRVMKEDKKKERERKKIKIKCFEKKKTF
jgi:hypothetical protein